MLLPTEEMEELQRFAAREEMTVGEWVRRALREARMQQPNNSSDVKLRAIRQAAEYSFPTGDVDQMLEEIERGYHP